MTPEEIAREVLKPWGVTMPEYDNLFDRIVAEVGCELRQATRAAYEDAAKKCDGLAIANEMSGRDPTEAKWLASEIRRAATREA